MDPNPALSKDDQSKSHPKGRTRSASANSAKTALEQTPAKDNDSIEDKGKSVAKKRTRSAGKVTQEQLVPSAAAAGHDVTAPPKKRPGRKQNALIVPPELPKMETANQLKARIVKQEECVPRYDSSTTGAVLPYIPNDNSVKTLVTNNPQVEVDPKKWTIGDVKEFVELNSLSNEAKFLQSKAVNGIQFCEMNKQSLILTMDHRFHAGLWDLVGRLRGLIKQIDAQKVRNMPRIPKKTSESGKSCLELQYEMDAQKNRRAELMYKRGTELSLQEQPKQRRSTYIPRHSDVNALSPNKDGWEEPATDENDWESLTYKEDSTQKLNEMSVPVTSIADETDEWGEPINKKPAMEGVPFDSSATAKPKSSSDSTIDAWGATPPSKNDAWCVPPVHPPLQRKVENDWEVSSQSANKKDEWGAPSGSVNKKDEWGAPSGSVIKNDGWSAPSGSVNKKDEWSAPSGSSNKKDEWGAPSGSSNKKDEWESDPAPPKKNSGWGTAATSTGGDDDWGAPSTTSKGDGWSNTGNSGNDNWTSPASDNSFGGSGGSTWNSDSNNSRGGRGRGSGRGGRDRGGSRGGMGRGARTPQEGDWNCPDDQCKVNNFAFRRSCFKCNTPKPGGSFSDRNDRGRGGRGGRGRGYGNGSGGRGRGSTDDTWTSTTPGQRCQDNDDVNDWGASSDTLKKQDDWGTPSKPTYRNDNWEGGHTKPSTSVSAPKNDDDWSAPFKPVSSVAASQEDDWGAPSKPASISTPKGDDWGAPSKPASISTPKGDDWGAPSKPASISTPKGDDWGAPSKPTSISTPKGDDWGAPSKPTSISTPKGDDWEVPSKPTASMSTPSKDDWGGPSKPAVSMSTPSKDDWGAPPKPPINSSAIQKDEFDDWGTSQSRGPAGFAVPSVSKQDDEWGTVSNATPKSVSNPPAAKDEDDWGSSTNQNKDEWSAPSKGSYFGGSGGSRGTSWSSDSNNRGGFSGRGRSGGDRGGRGRTARTPQEGDWQCPDDQCKTTNFSFRRNCFKCSAPKPGGSGGGRYEGGSGGRGGRGRRFEDGNGGMKRRTDEDDWSTTPQKKFKNNDDADDWGAGPTKPTGDSLFSPSAAPKEDLDDWGTVKSNPVRRVSTSFIPNDADFDSWGTGANITPQNISPSPNNKREDAMGNASSSKNNFATQKDQGVDWGGNDQGYSCSSQIARRKEHCDNWGSRSGNTPKHSNPGISLGRRDGNEDEWGTGRRSSSTYGALKRERSNEPERSSVRGDYSFEDSAMEPNNSNKLSNYKMFLGKEKLLITAGAYFRKIDVKPVEETRIGFGSKGSDANTMRAQTVQLTEMEKESKESKGDNKCPAVADTAISDGIKSMGLKEATQLSKNVEMDSAEINESGVSSGMRVESAAVKLQEKCVLDATEAKTVENLGENSFIEKTKVKSMGEMTDMEMFEQYKSVERKTFEMRMGNVELNKNSTLESDVKLGKDMTMETDDWE